MFSKRKGFEIVFYPATIQRLDSLIHRTRPRSFMSSVRLSVFFVSGCLQLHKHPHTIRRIRKDQSPR